MIQLNRILVPTDFSEFGQHALRYGCELGRRFDSELHLLHIVDDAYPMVPEAGMLMPAQTDYLLELKSSAQKSLEGIPDPQWSEGIVEIVRHVDVGSPFVEIIRYAKAQEIDLIVLGTHGRTGIVHVLMGSVAERVVRKSPCPVLTVRPEGHDFVMP